MATKDLSAEALKTPLSLLGIAGDIKPGSWGSQSTEDVGNYGEKMDDLGFEQEAIDKINAASVALLDFRDLAAPDGVTFDDSSLLRFGTDANGGLSVVSGPVVKAKDGNPVLIMGNNTLPIEEVDGEFKVGELTGSLSVQEGKSYTNFRIQFQDPKTGDRYRVKCYVKEGVTEDDLLDGIAAGTSLGEFLKGAGDGKGMSMNMAELELGDYRVLGVTRRSGKDGKPDWFTLKLEGYDQEVKSRAAIDALLTNGFKVEPVLAKGKVCVLSVTSKTSFGDKGYFQIGCSLQALEPGKAEPRLKETADKLKLEKAHDAPSAKKPASAEVQATSGSTGPSRAAKAAAARKQSAPAVDDSEVAESSEEVAINF